MNSLTRSNPNQKRLPKWRRTFEFVSRLAEHITFGKIAAVSGKRTDVAEAWGRPHESDDFPAGTGKKDPSQTVIRLLGLAHSNDPGLAREWASTFPEYVDYLDAKAGTRSTEGVCEFAARYVKESAEMIVKILHEGGEDFEGLWTELAQCESAFHQLKACIKEQMSGTNGKSVSYKARQDTEGLADRWRAGAK